MKKSAERPGPVTIKPAGTAPPVAATGHDNHEALLGWMKNELSKGTERAYDLGKFLFSVSIGTAGLVAVLTKDAARPWLLIFAIFLDALSAIAALAVAWPKTWTLGQDVDLATVYNDAMKRSVRELRRWAWFYTPAFVVSALAILLRA